MINQIRRIVHSPIADFILSFVSIKHGFKMIPYGYGKVDLVF